MKKSLFVALSVASTLTLLAEPSGDRPDVTHAWAVHDVNRPDPMKVEVSPSGIPSDAIVLFDGTAESVKKNWRGEGGVPTKWTVKDSTFVCTPGSGSAMTAEKFGDCQLHVEFQTPVNDVEGWGNSGVILMGRYEIQILDSSAIEPSKSPWKPANYADGQVGAVYGQNPPMVNPCRKPGEWQSYDIIFHPPYREGKRLVDPGSFTVFLNGVLVQDNWQLEGATTWCRRYVGHPEESEGPLCLQDHGHPVPFRNVWIRRIPSRYANTTCGGVGVKQAEVAKLRHVLAAQSRTFAEEADTAMERFIRLWEAYCYEPDRKVKAMLPQVEADCLADIKACRGGFETVKFHAFKRFVEMLVKSGYMPAEAKIKSVLDAMKGPAKPTAPNLRDV